MKKFLTILLSLIIVTTLTTCDFDNNDFDNDWSTALPVDYDVQNEFFIPELIDMTENHSFHIHNAQFLVMEIDEEEVDFREIGWKDMIYLRPRESKIIQIQFKQTGLFMLHCHILIHEEEGMMLLFQVNE